jgi:hypothetical protein
MSIKDPFEHVNNLNKLAASAVKRASDCSLETVNELLSIGSKHLKGGSVAKNAEEVIHMANDVGAAYINCTQRALHVALENFSDFSRWLENNAHLVNPMTVKPFGDKSAAEKRA